MEIQTGDRTLPGLALVGWIASWTDNVTNILAGANIGGEYCKQVIGEDRDVNFDGMVDICDLTLMGGYKMLSLLKLIRLGTLIRVDQNSGWIKPEYRLGIPKQYSFLRREISVEIKNIKPDGSVGFDDISDVLVRFLVYRGTEIKQFQTFAKVTPFMP